MATDYRKALLGTLSVGENPPPDDGQVPDTIPFTPDDPRTYSGIRAGEDAPNTGPAPVLDQPITPPPAETTNPYRDGSTVNIAGWDPTRTDNTGKYEFGRAVQQAKGRGETYNADWVRKFVADNANEWELDPRSSANDPHIRQKQSWLDDPTKGDGKTGHTSIYQDVLGDSGGANIPQFSNVEGDPALGYEAAQGGGGGAPGGSAATLGGAQLDEALNGDPLAKIQQLIAQMSGSRPNFAALMQQLGAA